MNKPPELKPCPFCGSEGTYSREIAIPGGWRGGGNVRCTGCGVMVQGGEKEESFKLWNTRQAPKN